MTGDVEAAGSESQLSKAHMKSNEPPRERGADFKPRGEVIFDEATISSEAHAKQGS